MKPESARRVFDMHGWTGVVFGALFYVLAISGALAVFVDDFEAWESEELHAFTHTIEDLDALLARVAEKNAERAGELPPLFLDTACAAPERLEAAGDEHVVRDLFLALPAPRRPGLGISYVGEQGFRTHRADPATGKLAERSDHGFTELVEDLHFDLLLPAPWGRYLVGVLGVVACLVVTSGLVVHRKMLRQLFRLRREGSSRRVFGDLHALIGAWLLPFHLVLSLTGALLGLVGVLLLVVAFAAFDGERDAALEAITGEEAVVSGRPAPPAPLEAAMERARAQWPAMKIEALGLEAWCDENARVSLNGHLEDRLAQGGLLGAELVFSATELELIERQDWTREGLAKRLFAMVRPLHYATFGGLVVDIAFFLAALAFALLTASGTWVWLERRRKELSSTSRRAHEGSFVGVVVGTPLALVGAALSDRLFFAGGLTFEHGEQWVFLALLAATIAATTFARAPWRLARTLALASAAACVVLALADFALYALAGWPHSPSPPGVSLGWLALGLSTFALLVRRPLPQR